MRTPRTPRLAIWLVPLLLAALPARAHKAKCFAAVEGDVISGYAWMGGGERARNAPYRVLGPDGSLLREGHTDAEGEFAFAPAGRCDHRILIDAGEGHLAAFTVPAGDLPAGLAAAVATAPPAAIRSDEPGMPASEGPRAPADTAAGGSGQSLEIIVERAVGRRIAPLQRELAEFQDRQRLQDIVAGLGYIAGLAGAAFFFLGSRRNRTRNGPGKP
jgi:nickel transport protein